VYQDGAAEPVVELTGEGTSTTTITGLVSATVYAFRVEAFDAAGNESSDGPSTEVSTGAGDVEAPQWLSATIGAPVLSESAVQLLWSGASDDVGVASYRVLDAGTGAELAVSSEPTAVVTGVSVGQSLVVEALDASGNASLAGTGPTLQVTELAGAGETIARPLGLSASDGVGESVSIDGDRAVVSAYKSDAGRGELRVYTRAGGQWRESAQLSASDAIGNDNLGFGEHGVALSGNTVIAGAWQADPSASGSGAAYVFVEDGTGSWSEQAKLGPSATGSNANFGRSVALEGDVAVVGAPRQSSDGRAYVFERTGTSWTEVAELSPSSVSSAAQFGFSVAISGDRIAVSANRDNTGGTNAGSVFVYEKVGSVWVEQAKIVAADGAGADFFGESVSLSGTTLVAGAPREDDTAANAGAAYVYEYDGTQWVQAAKLLAGDGGRIDQFGVSTSIDGDVIAVGAHLHDAAVGGVSVGNAGATYVYGRSGGVWVELDPAKLVASDAASNDRYGRSVGVDGMTVVSGANEAGSAYFYEIDTSTPGDVTLPSWVGGELLATGVTDTEAQLSWSGASDDVGVVGYRLYVVTGRSDRCRWPGVS
jgi:hypothetical protein